MKFIRFLLGLTLLAAACSAGDVSHPPSPRAPQPIVDSAPYLCSYIPEGALRVASGATGPITDLISGVAEFGQCSAPKDHPYIVYLAWAQEGGEWSKKEMRLALEDKKKIYSRYGGRPLPVELGDGMMARIDSGLPNLPYEMAAVFSCGGKRSYLTFSFSGFVAGRDGFKDMTDLMRIAQKRHAELHGCNLGR